ncbi:MAG: hypothetical protein FJ225_11750 [Lentisphaerae bacterium]|nr:hypothetical protein [Lentisphaerota bacterium]
MTNWRQIAPTTVTLGAMLSGFLSILTTVEGMRSGRTEMYMRASQLIMLAMILDGLDGNLARFMRGSSEFGAELDTYVDLTAFGIAPALLIFAVSMQSRDPIWRVILPSAVALSGVVRLARFKVRDPLRGQAGYAGLPITANAAWVALFVFISLAPPRDAFRLDEGPVASLFLAGIVVFIVLQVTSLHYPKPSKKLALFVPCAVLVALLWALSHRMAVRVAVFMIVLGTGYVVFGPLFVKGVAAHKARRDAKALAANGAAPNTED